MYIQPPYIESNYDEYYNCCLSLNIPKYEKDIHKFFRFLIFNDKLVLERELYQPANEKQLYYVNINLFNETEIDDVVYFIKVNNYLYISMVQTSHMYIFGRIINILLLVNDKWLHIYSKSYCEDFTQSDIDRIKSNLHNNDYLYRKEILRLSLQLSKLITIIKKLKIYVGSRDVIYKMIGENAC